MKRWVHAASIPQQVKKIADAKKALAAYAPEKVAYVKECQDELTRAISDSYDREEDDRPVGPILSEIKRDYLVGAIEDDLMTEEEFEDILALVDVIDFELSAPYA